MAITDEPLDLSLLNLVWRQTITMHTNSVWNIVYVSTVTNMTMVQIYYIWQI